MRRRHVLRFGQHEISSSVGISRTSVRNYLARAKRAGLSWPLPEQLEVIEPRLFKRTAFGMAMALLEQLEI